MKKPGWTCLSRRCCRSSRPARLRSPTAGLATAVAAAVFLAGGTSRAEDENAAAAASETPPAGADRDAALQQNPFTVSGLFNQRYRFRSSGAGQDQDIYGYLNLDGDYRATSSNGPPPFERIRLNFQASSNLDIDDFKQAEDVRTDFEPFLDITNTFGSRFTGYIHSGYLSAVRLGPIDELRLGRQMLYREEGLLFDGGTVRTAPWNSFTFEAFGGLPAHLYESSRAGDAMAGATIESRPVEGLRLGADYVYIRDHGDDRPDAVDHLYIFRGRYLIGQEWALDASGSWVDTRDRRQTLGLQYVSQQWGLLADFRFLRQNGIVDFQSSELSPYVFVEGKYAPFLEYQVNLHQPWGRHFGTGAGVQIRDLQDRSEEGTFNHSFENYYVSVDVIELWQGSRATLRGDYWDADGQDVYSTGFELEQKLCQIVTARLGTSWSLYRIDPLTGAELNRDRIYYVRLRWHVTKRIDIDTDYEYEKDSQDDYHRVVAGFQVSF